LEKLFFVQNEIFVLETATKRVTGLTFPPQQIDLRLTAPFALSLHWLALIASTGIFEAESDCFPLTEFCLVVFNSVKSDNSLTFCDPPNLLSFPFRCGVELESCLFMHTIEF
jgi:hypothetical protein